MNKKIMAIFLICCVFLISSCSATEWEVTSSTEGDISELSLMTGGAVQQKNVCVVKPNDVEFYDGRYMPGEYFVLADQEDQTRTEYDIQNNSTFVRELNRQTLTVVDAQTGTIRKVIDTKEILESPEIAPLFEEYEYFNVSRWWSEDNGKYYVEIHGMMDLFSENYTEISDYKYLFINVDTEEMIIAGDNEPFDIKWTESNGEFNRKMRVFSRLADANGDEYDFWGANGYSNNDSEENPLWISVVPEYLGGESWAEVQLSSEYLPQNNSTLYAEFPGLKEYIGQEGYTVTLYLADSPDPETILSYIFEEGQEISFEGAYLSAERSTDGQAHEIHSFDEFYQWY